MRMHTTQKSLSFLIRNLSLFLCLCSVYFISTATAADCVPLGAGDATVSENCANLVITAGGNITISGNVTATYFNPAIKNSGITTSLSNLDLISGDYYGVLLDINSSITTLKNSGIISSDLNNGIELVADTHITTLTNTGRISGYGNVGIYNNAGLSEGSFGSAGTIETLNNLQGLSGDESLPLTYFGKVPNNYNIIIHSISQYGRFSLSLRDGNSGSMSFGVSPTSNLTSHTYSEVLIGVNNTMLTTGSFSGSLGRASWLLQEKSLGSGIWDLVVSGEYIYSTGPSVADTQVSLNTQARRLRSTFNSSMASGNFANMNTYDCNLFDKNNMCISAGGRYTNLDNPSSNNSAAVVVLGYKVNSNIRIGGFLDQSVNNNAPTGIQVSNKNPMMGAFAVWNQNPDGLGYQVKIANAYQDKDVTSTRDAFGETGEPGTGKTNLNTQSYVGELSYAFNYQDSTIVRPYFALRYTNIKQDAYTETGVSTPLSYAKLGDRSTTALMGVKLNHALTPRTNLTASLGIEQDINHKTDQLVASGVADLTSENFNNHIKRTRPVASAGAYYAVTKTQRLSGEVYYQQLPFQSTGSATAYVNYMIGF